MSRPRTMSRANGAWLLGALLLLTCEAASARNAVIDSNLNLRVGPGPSHRVLLVMPAGATVKVGDCGGEWCQVEYRGQRGYVSSALVKGGDSAFAAAPQPAARDSRPDAGARVWQWHDREWRDRYWGELESHRRQR